MRRDRTHRDSGAGMLTADAETSMGMTRDQVLEMEMEGFADLIRIINRYGNKSNILSSQRREKFTITCFEDSNRKNYKIDAVMPITSGLDDHGNCNDHTCHLEGNCHIAFFQTLPRNFNTFCQFVEDVEGQVNCTDRKNNPEDKPDERNCNGKKPSTEKVQASGLC